MRISFANRKSKFANPSNPAALRRPAPVVRDRRRVLDRVHANARLCDGADGRFAAPARPFYADLYLTHSGLGRLARGLPGGLLGRERGALSRAAKAPRTRRRLGDQIALRVRDRDERIVERSRDMNDPHRDVLPLLLLKDR